jgi:hydroxymethylbilane synthase
MSETFRIGTRASEMAVRQSEEVIQRLCEAFPEHRFEMVTRPADADLDLKSRLSAMGGKGGAFISAMRSMIACGEADMAMHSLKDLPGNDEYYANTSYSLGACLPRSDPRDALVLKGAEALKDRPSPAVIGTSSVRRAAFLRRLFPDSDIVPRRSGQARRPTRSWRADAIQLWSADTGA